MHFLSTNVCDNGNNKEFGSENVSINTGHGKEKDFFKKNMDSRHRLIQTTYENMSLFQTFQVLFVCGLFTRTIQPKFSFFKLAVTCIPNAAPTEKKIVSMGAIPTHPNMTNASHVRNFRLSLVQTLPLLYVEEIYRLLMGLDCHVAAVAARL